MSYRQGLTEARIREILALLKRLKSRANKRGGAFLAHPEHYDVSKPSLELVGPRFLAVLREEGGDADAFVRDYYWLIFIYYYVKGGGVAAALDAARPMTKEESWMPMFPTRKSRALRLRRARSWAEMVRKKVTMLEQVTEAEERAVSKCFFEIEEAAGFSQERERALLAWKTHFDPAA
jgi:hypothetical protein